ncbi:MAG TPA: hypothetical protein VEC19_04045 [Usitatibacter sp.]|nr:hypothetical protein [Usitatibacter sp.]
MEVPRYNIWQCVGCGRIEDPQPCVGICRDVRVEFVPAAAHDAAMARLSGEIEALREIVRRIATTSPRTGESERTWKALQARAREVLMEFPPGA